MTEDAKRGWIVFTEMHGVTFTATIEATGLLLDQNAGRLIYDVDAIVELARKIDRERYKRS